MAELKKVGKWLESQSKQIVYEWLSQPPIKELFFRYKISLNQFANKFAVPILKYNIEVFKGTKELAACPVMDKFVEYMIKKDIQSVDVFLICSHLREAVFNKLYDSYSGFSEKTLRKEMGEIFDRNIAGVLRNYDAAYGSAIKEKHENSHKESDYQATLQQILDTQPNAIFKLKDQDIFVGNKALLQITGMDDLESFKQRYSHPLEFIKQVEIAEELFNLQQYLEWMDQIFKEHEGSCKVTVYDHTLSEDVKMHMQIAQLNKDEKYVVSFTKIDEHQKHNGNESFTMDGDDTDDALLSDEVLQQEQTKFLELMKKYQNENKKPSLTNYYLELAIKSDATIVEVNKDNLVINIRKLALFSLKVNDKVYFKMEEGNDFQALVKDISIHRDIVVLQNFQSVEHSPLDRKNISVELERLLGIKIKTPNYQFKAYIKSLSSEECLVLSENLYDLEEGIELTIWAKFDQKETQYTGIVQKVSTIKSSFQVIIKFEYNEQHEDELNHFVSQRQLGIIQELQQKVQDEKLLKVF